MLRNSSGHLFIDIIIILYKIDNNLLEKIFSNPLSGFTGM